MSETRVTHIAIGRLHNLGNYEHIRYDVTVELPEGAHDAGEVIHKLERLLGSLKPIKKDYSYDRAKQAIADVAANPEKLGVDYSNASMVSHESTVAKYEKSLERRQSALRAFDNLGGVATFTDAKARWEDDDDYDW